MLMMFFISISKFYAQGNRQLISLNESNWRFLKQDVSNFSDVNLKDTDWLKIKIPHDWNGGIDGVNFDVFKGPEMYLGVGCYRNRFNVDKSLKGKQLKLIFEAVSLKADVWINGHYLGNHKGGYTAFSFDITPYVKFDSENVIAVKASNVNDPSMAPWMKDPYGVFPNSSDYAVYGGIYRDVWLQVTENTYIVSEKHHASVNTDKSGNVNITTSICNKNKFESKLILKTQILDNNKVLKESEKEIKIAPEGTIENSELLTVNNIGLWSPSNPKLYTVRVRLISDTKEIDKTESTLGFRTYTLKNGTAFILNGEKIFLHGTNRHQDREGFGYALTNEQHWHDMKLIKSLGFNFMRHAHYPCDEAVLDACDQLGIMVWLEIPVSTCISPEPGFLENAKSQLAEMINEHYNHPCIIVWGLGNESDRSGASTEQYTNTFFKELNSLAHSLDNTRPTTGCNFTFDSNHSIPDVYAPQDWLGWYAGNLNDYHPTKMIGEYGADSHIPSHDETLVTNSSTKPWTQESACRIHEYKVSKGESVKDSFPGQLTWVAFDFASPRKDRSTNPIPFMNQKGLVAHDHTTLKDVAYFYRSFYTSADTAPMVYIVSHTWTDRVKAPGTYNFWAYSNCDSVVLYNGDKTKSFGFRIRNAGPRGDTRFEWQNINITGPVLKAEGYYKGKLVATDEIKFTEFKP